MLNLDFTDRICIVTGGTRGIGAATAKALLQNGATVIATYASNDQTAQQFLAENDNGHLSVQKFNVANYAECEVFFKNFDTSFSKLDVLIASAGIRLDSITAMMPAENWQKVLDVNLTGAFNMAKLACLRMLPNRFGRLIFVTSPMGKMGFAGQANYAASKAGLVALAKSLAKETAKRGITANCVSPGFIDTDFIGNLTPEQTKEYVKMVPTNRFGTPEEVADAILYLASEQAAYINGTVLEIAGGLG